VKKLAALDLNRMTVKRKVADISEDVETQLSAVFNKCVCYSHTADESTAVTSQKICIFARGATYGFEEFEDFLSMQCRKK
jgi:hypothetical protein